MKYKTLFRLALKFMGVWLLIEGVLAIVFQLAMSAEYDGTIEYPAWTFVPQIARVAVGAYLFFGGRWVADLAIPGNRRYCPECAYDLHGLSAARCPECGTPAPPQDAPESG